VGGGWGDVHGITAGDGWGVGVLPGVVAGHAIEEEDAGEQDDGGEEGGFRTYAPPVNSRGR